MEYGALDDFFAQEEIKKLFNNFNIKRIIETGTYFGWSTKFLSQFNVPVDTIEVSNQNYLVAKENLHNLENVTLHLGNSPEILEKIINYQEEKLLILLDAHWEQYLPLLDELEIISQKKLNDCVIVIHDFFVPGGYRKKRFDYVKNDWYYEQLEEPNGSKFGYDYYNDKDLNFEYIEEKIKNVYNQNFDYHYTSEIEKVDSGLIYIYPKK